MIVKQQPLYYRRMFLVVVSILLLLLSRDCDGLCPNNNNDHHQYHQQYHNHHDHVMMNSRTFLLPRSTSATTTLPLLSTRMKYGNTRWKQQQHFMVASSVSPFSEDNHEDNNKDNYRTTLQSTLQSQQQQKQQRQHVLLGGDGNSTSRRRNIMSAIMSKGTRIHLLYSVIMLIIPILSWNIPYLRRSCSTISRYAMTFSFIGMFYDNLINGIGKYLITDANSSSGSDALTARKSNDDESSTSASSKIDETGGNDNMLLRRLTKGRYLFHAAVMPLAFLPLLEVVTFMDVGSSVVGGVNVGAGFFKRHINFVSGCFIIALAMAIIECIDWIHYNSKQFIKIDQRYAKTNIQHHIVGTFKYTCPNILKCVLPAIITTLLEINIGLYITITKIRHISVISPGATTVYSLLPGILILSAGCTALLSATAFSKKPQYQLVLEPLSLLMIWTSASCLY